ncbi:hypothetical protein TRFO_35191 [Tritrichomonas foetus]|uniref:DUF1963 domain-containing protein n=1 Tax=Tritrichomonas foetus TaxID=1144522 RepID=A0A1J4JJA4_9EUKA|nr:hypothetical protein TRFO_35191 [Tritrichomonas foetus]|eukprot:OHS98415.1 hypothetical protein TRFO_35191 [Tritrichomonas foetus]
MLKEPALSQEERPFWNFFLQNNLWQTGYEPVCNLCESTSPKVSKFGGYIPHLPQEPPHVCSECDKKKEVLLQLYIPDAPQPVKELFPDQLQKSLIVFTYCTECMSSNEENSISYNVYSEEEIPSLVFDQPPEDYKINSSVITNWAPFRSIDGSTSKFYDLVNEAGLDDVQMEEFVRELKNKYAGTTYLRGNADFTEGEYDAPEGMVLLASFEQDKNFSMMWGDAGVAHLWMKPREAFGEFNLTWLCG